MEKLIMENKLKNLEELKGYLESAFSNINLLEQSWEEDTLTDDQENRVIDIRDQIDDLIYEIQNTIDEIENGKVKGLDLT